MNSRTCRSAFLFGKIQFHDGYLFSNFSFLSLQYQISEQMFRLQSNDSHKLDSNMMKSKLFNIKIWSSNTWIQIQNNWNVSVSSFYFNTYQLKSILLQMILKLFYFLALVLWNTKNERIWEFILSTTALCSPQRLNVHRNQITTVLCTIYQMWWIRERTQCFGFVLKAAPV